MISAARPSSLFPYTTLFRSDPGWRARSDTLRSVAADGLAHRLLFARRSAELAQEVFEDVPAVHADRKSTRLNSSHMSISYAVFCLKKKIISICVTIHGSWHS